MNRKQYRYVPVPCECPPPAPPVESGLPYDDQSNMNIYISKSGDAIDLDYVVYVSRLKYRRSESARTVTNMKGYVDIILDNKNDPIKFVLISYSCCLDVLTDWNAMKIAENKVIADAKKEYERLINEWKNLAQ